MSTVYLLLDPSSRGCGGEVEVNPRILKITDWLKEGVNVQRFIRVAEKFLGRLGLWSQCIGTCRPLGSISMTGFRFLQVATGIGERSHGFGV